MEFRKYFSKFLQKRKKLTEQESRLCSELSAIIGFNVQNIDIYKEAFSLKKYKSKNYERLEFLGDTVLGTIISSHLFSIYPKANEGFLTQMKSKIVNRKNLNRLGDEFHITDFIQNKTIHNPGVNISGNLFEAFIGAIFLDFGYEVCQKVVLEKMFTPEQINRLEHKIVSYKSLLLEWSQKKKVDIRYETNEEKREGNNFTFRCNIWIGNRKAASALESSKKKAEEKAAQRVFYMLNKKRKGG
ncbi:MAG: ribonuclease III [Flavobacteriaceae bacterium]|jgi:ribonuclease-3|nr:ribonuclease III [Flavobacteriaceae bacterium]